MHSIMKLRFFMKLLTHRKMTNGIESTHYIKEIRKLQREGFYRVDLGETKIPEGLITGDLSSLVNSLRHKSAWSIVHAGGARGWVPWDYRIFFYEEQVKWAQSSEDGFHELCSVLRDSYGKCAIMANAQDWTAASHNDNNGTLHVRPSSPIELLSMMCCPNVAEAYGHELLQLPAQYAHLSPLNEAWWTVKWYISSHREKYSEEVNNRGTLHKHIFYRDLIEDSLKSMTGRKWKDAVSWVRKTEDYYLKKDQ